MAGGEPGADPMGQGGIVDRLQAVVEGGEADAGLGQLPLGPLVAVGAQPQRVGGVAAELEEGGAPVVIPQVEVPMVGDGRHPLVGEMGVVGTVARVGGVGEAPPGRRALLGFADEDDPGPVYRCRRILVGPGQVFLVLASLEAHHGQVMGDDEGVEVGDQAVMVLGQTHRRRDVITPVDQEADDPVLVLQARDVPRHPDPIHGRAAERHLLGR